MSWSMPVVARSLEKKSRCPSGDSAGPASFLVVLIVGPRFTAVSQAPSVEERWATQRSRLSMHPVADTRFPKPPGRSERKYRLSSSLDMVGVWSWHRELTGARRGTGSDHSELAKDMACSLGAAGPDSEAHATSNATDSSASAVAASTDLMVTSWLVPARRAGGH